MKPRRILRGSWAQKSFYAPFVVGKTPVFAVPKGRFGQLLIRGEAAKRTGEGPKPQEASGTESDKNLPPKV